MRSLSIREFVEQAPSLPSNQTVQVRGTVTLHHSGGAIFLQDATGAVLANAATNSTVQVGDVVEAWGKVTKEGFSPYLADASYRTLGRRDVVQPKTVTGASLRTGRFDMELVRVQGRLLAEPTYIAGLQQLHLNSDGTLVTLSLSGAGERNPLSQLRPGSILQAEGVCSVGATGQGRPGNIRVHLRSTNDIVVQRPPPWWTVERAVLALGLVVMGALAALTWVATLRREVYRQTEKVRQLNQELEKRVAERTIRLQETVAELEQYSYSISHDMRGPLRAMNQFSTILLDDYGPRLDREAQDLLRRISGAAHRMDELIQDVLHYSRISRGELPIAPVDLDILVRELIQDYPGLQRAEIQIQGPLLPVLANPAALTQCLSNLLSNGVKFVAPGTSPELRIWTEPRLSNVRIWIADNGIGISHEHLQRIWGIFDRLHGAETYEGTGIGLSIVKRAVERMGGSVGVESEPGCGSRFWFELRRP